MTSSSEMPFQDLQMTVDKLRAREAELIQTRQELRDKKQGLDELKEHQRQAIIRLQMDIEQESSKLEEARKLQETSAQRIQHISGGSAHFRRHGGKVNQCMSQIDKMIDSMQQSASEWTEKVNRAKLEARDVLPSQLLEIRALQSELQEEYNQSKMLAQALRQSASDCQSHADAISSLKMENACLDVSIKDKELELASLKESNRNLREDEHKSQLFDEEILQQLGLQVAAAESLCENLNHELEKKQREKEWHSSQLDIAKKENDIVTESITTIENDKILLTKKEYELTLNLSGIETVVQGSLEDLQRFSSQNDEMELQLTDLNEELQGWEEERRRNVSELSKQVAISKNTALMRLDELNQALNSAALDADIAEQLIKNTTDEVLTVESELQKAKSSKDEEESQNSFLNNQLTTKRTEFQNLQSELERINKLITDEQEKAFHVETLLQQQQELIEREENELYNKLEDAKGKILKIEECVHEKKEEINLLNQKFEDIRKELSEKQLSTKHQFSSKIADLEKKRDQLTELKEQVTLENGTVSSSLNDDLCHKNSMLAKLEEKTAESSEVNAALLIEINILKQAVMDQNLQIATAEQSMTASNETVKNLIRDSEDVDKLLHELDTRCSQQDKLSKEKNEALRILKNEMDTFEISKTESLFKNSVDIKSLLNDMVQSKQTCESLFSKTSLLNLELHGLKKAYALATQEFDQLQESVSVRNIKAGNCRRVADQKKCVVDKLSRDLEIIQNKAKKAKLDLQLQKDEYNTVIKKISDAKARKRAHFDGSSAWEEQNTKASSSLASSQVTPQSILKSSKEQTPVMSGCEEKEITPRSILKPVKESTPLSAKKSVSFSLNERN